ncbi:META domain-containing protein [Petropleomorpha daqingensis]|uniref:Heat shock protein HslJ n=1 Tax=Petropleomorpha daqingensis TaxID=2026353 RepID=A0A853C9X6_9ACTN|nr:heat shock protein HslJ [Petropleomorpha daqingensis]
MTRVLLVALLALAGCGGGAAAGPDVLGEWVLVSGVPQPSGVPATLVVEDAQLRGISFCNHYAGSYTLDGDVLAVSGLGGSDMGCEPAVMAAETAFLTALGRADRVTRDGADLVLSGPEGSLRFARQAPVPDRELAGTTWTLDTLVDGEVALSVLGSPTLELAPDGTATGSTGCRGFVGTWSVAGDVLTLDVTRDDIGCPADLGRQDEHVLAVLDAAPTSAIDGDRLTLTAPDARELVYRAE